MGGVQPGSSAPADGAGVLKSQAAPTAPEVKIKLAFRRSWWEREARGSDRLWDSPAWVFSGTSYSGIVGGTSGTCVARMRKA